jgi:glycosyltransferase involved in cell wall biosynthesis
MEGGVGAFTQELAVAIRDLDHPVHIFTRQREGFTAQPDITISAEVRGKWGWATISQAQHWATTHNLDILNIQFQTAAYDMHPAIHWLPQAMANLSIPTLTTFHDLRAPYLFPKAGPLRTWVVRKLASTSSAAIVTDHQDETVLKGSWKIGNVRWIPIGSNVKPMPLQSVSRAEVRQRLGIRDDQLLVSYFGFLNESKGALVLIDALGELVATGVDVHAIMIGGRAGASDPTNWQYGKNVDAAISRIGLTQRVMWSGFVDDSTVSAYLYASDLCVLPYLDGASLRRGTLMAALAHGRAIITTTPARDLPEIRDAIKAVRPNDASALSQAIISLWRDAGQRELLERESAAASRQFEWTRIAQTTIEYFSEQLKS